MQEILSTHEYPVLVKTTSDLRQMREKTGLSVRELARQIGESHTNVSYWERSGQLPRSDKLIAIAKAPMGVAATLMSLSPVLLLPVSHFGFKEKVGGHGILGTLLALAGAAALFFV